MTGNEIEIIKAELERLANIISEHDSLINSFIDIPIVSAEIHFQAVKIASIADDIVRHTESITKKQDIFIEGKIKALEATIDKLGPYTKNLESILNKRILKSY